MRNTLVVILLFLGSVCHGQVDSVRMHNWLFTFSPSAFINYHPGVQFGVEKFFNENHSLEVELARLFRVLRDGDEEQTQGARLKLGYKRHFNTRSIFYTTLFLRYTQHDHLEWFSRFNNLYQEQIFYQSHKTLTGATIGIGSASRLSKRIIGEAAIHAGVAAYFVRVDDLPEDLERFDANFLTFYNGENNYFFPIFRFSFKLKFDLSKPE